MKKKKVKAPAKKISKKEEEKLREEKFLRKLSKDPKTFQNPDDE